MKQKSILKVFKEHNVEFIVNDGVKYVETRSLAMALGVAQEKNGVDYPRIERFLHLWGKNGIQQVTFGNKSYVAIDDAIETSMLVRNKVGKEFRKWLTNVVKTIDATGSYIEDTRKAAEFYCEKVLGHKRTDKCWEREVELLVRDIELNKKAQELELKNTNLTNTINDCIHNKNSYLASDVAAYCGFKSPQMLHEFCKNNHILKRMDDCWIVCAEYAYNGYFCGNKHTYAGNELVYENRWTFEGREFIKNLAKQTFDMFNLSKPLF